ncbi:hypothetical protein [Heyndrickxia ginsengihumi]|uniref:hypothetical protein n=1 Tax=Heyndrickxia ginsengihumi TaxID=363870 RepID=UPI00046EA6BE|nr:hypothetical protein [Heyndrickxia ginsengihumi]
MNKTITVNGRKYVLTINEDQLQRQYNVELFDEKEQCTAERNFKTLEEIQKNLRNWIISNDIKQYGNKEEYVWNQLNQWDGVIEY